MPHGDSLGVEEAVTGFLACAVRIYVQNVMWLPTVRYVKVTSSVGPILIMRHTTGTSIEDIFSITLCFFWMGGSSGGGCRNFYLIFFFFGGGGSQCPGMAIGAPSCLICNILLLK